MGDTVIFHNEDFLLASKPSGVLSQHSPDMYSIQKDIEHHFGRKFHILTRLDRPVSGLVLFSKNSAFSTHYQNNQSEGKISKRYIAIVEGSMKIEAQSMKAFHYQDKKAKKARISLEARPKFKQIESSLEVKAVLDNYTIVEVDILKGAFHQIRAQLAHLGHPVKGDVKYGARRSNRDRSIHLHAHSIKFEWKAKEQFYESKIPTIDNLWKIIGSEYYP